MRADLIGTHLWSIQNRKSNGGTYWGTLSFYTYNDHILEIKS
ncbi:MAG: hypothetical protein ACI9EW_001457 [Cellvibrionaceae bacterium]|jgi:hypothetical protein